MTTHAELYGPHAALLDDCNVTVYTNATLDRHMTITHMPTGITVQASGTSQIMLKRELLDELAGKMLTGRGRC